MDDDEGSQTIRRYAAAARADILAKAEDAARWTGLVALARANDVGPEVLAQLETSEGAKREALSHAMNAVNDPRLGDPVTLLRAYAKLASIASDGAPDQEGLSQLEVP